MFGGYQIVNIDVDLAENPQPTIDGIYDTCNVDKIIMLKNINLNKVKSTCFKTRLKSTSFKTEINVDIETYLFKIILLLIKQRKEIFKIKGKFNEQSSNNRIIKNINVKH